MWEGSNVRFVQKLRRGMTQKSVGRGKCIDSGHPQDNETTERND